MGDSGLSWWQFWLLNLLALGALLLLFANLVLGARNRVAQLEVEAQRIAVERGMRLRELNRELTAALARVAEDTGDRRLQAMLAARGVPISSRTRSSGTPGSGAVPHGEGR
jgi:hypothetical protein